MCTSADFSNFQGFLSLDHCDCPPSPFSFLLFSVTQQEVYPQTLTSTISTQAITQAISVVLLLTKHGPPIFSLSNNFLN